MDHVALRARIRALVASGALPSPGEPIRQHRVTPPLLEVVCAVCAEAAPQVTCVRDRGRRVHLHATSDGAYVDVGTVAATLEQVDGVVAPEAPFHIHFSDIACANRNETKHLPYGEGTLRVEPLRDALARFERPATVISESPDEASLNAIQALFAAVA